MRSFVKRNIKKLVNRCGYKITRSDNQQYFNFQALIHYYLAQNNFINFVQVGGCDGSSFDPLYPIIKSKPEAFGGIIIEPVQDYFKELTAIHKNNPQIKPLRYAIHNSLKEAVLYKIDPDILHKLPDFAKGVVSFDRNHIGKFDLPVENIVEEKVPCKTLHEIMTEQNVKSPDLLLTDTEGYDAEILLNNDFEINRPPIIHFEHGIRENMISNKQLEDLFEKLHSYQYELIFQDFDAIAIHRDLLLSITK